MYLTYTNVEKEIFNDFLLTRPKDCNLQSPKFIIKAIKIDEKILEVKVKSDKPAFFVSLSIDTFKGHFSENCFTMIANQEKIISFRTNTKIEIDVDDIKIEISHLRTTYD